MEIKEFRVISRNHDSAQIVYLKDGKSITRHSKRVKPTLNRFQYQIKEMAFDTETEELVEKVVETEIFVVNNNGQE